jgi:hypothetical protein
MISGTRGKGFLQKKRCHFDCGSPRLGFSALSGVSLVIASGEQSEEKPMVLAPPVVAPLLVGHVASAELMNFGDGH